MFGVRKPVRRAVISGLALAAMACLSGVASAQFTSNKPPVHHRETNVARMARIQRTIQETYSHRWEVFGGGGYMRFRSGDVTKKNNEVTWNVDTHYFLNPKLSVVGDARGMFGNAHPEQFNQSAQVSTAQINEYTFMGGASYRFYAKEKVAVSVEGLGGVGWGIFSGGSKGLIASQYLGIWQDGVKPAFSIGISGDYNIYPNLALRVTPTYVGTTFSSRTGGTSLQNNFGFNMGVVYRFGRR
jgi:hypothetical protein